MKIIKMYKEAQNPRVAMDFTSGKGKLVNNASEAAEIARREILNRHQKTSRFQTLTPAPPDSLHFGPHLTQGYYHGNLSREQAEDMLIENGTDGAFILRDSKNRSGCLVITYMHALRPLHQYVSPVLMQESKENIYLATCDRDLVFYDVHSLIEFHRLNKGSLHRTLTVAIKNGERPDGTPPRHRKLESTSQLSEARNSQPGPSTSSSTSHQGGSTVTHQLCAPERERHLSAVQPDSDVATVSEAQGSSKSSSKLDDLLTSLDIHTGTVALIPLSPSLVTSPQGSTSPNRSREGASPNSSPQPSSQKSPSDSPEV